MKKVKLTDRAALAAKSDLADTIVPGLFVRVRDKSKSYCLVARFDGPKGNGTRRKIGPVVPGALADARKTAQKWLQMISVGKDPADELQAERAAEARKRADTIAAVWDAYRATKVAGMRTQAEIEQMFDAILVPLFGDRPIAALTHVEVSTAMREIENLGTDHALVKLRKRAELKYPTRKAKPARTQARALFCYLDGMLRWAAGTGDYGIEFSPLLRVKKADRFCKKVERERVLSDVEIACVWRGSFNMLRPYGQLYRLLLLTGLRLREVSDGSWDEFDPKLTEWTIPAKRMKGGKAHTVPITSHMRDVLSELPRGNRGSFVFSINGGAQPIAYRGRQKPMLDQAMLQDLGLPDSALGGSHCPIQAFRNHDLRRTMRTRTSMLGIPDVVGEAILAHKPKGMAGIYNRNHRIDERRDAHELWGDWLIKNSGERKIVRLRKAA